MCHILGKPVPQWSVPHLLFDLVGSFSSRIRYKVNKLLGDEYYSSAKWQGLGFRAEKSLLDFDR